MSYYSGVFQYLDETGAEMQGGACKVSIDPPILSVVPLSGPSISMDLGDIDSLIPGDYQLSLALYTGKSLVLTKFAKAFQNFTADLTQAYRDRLVQCLLLEDLEETGRFEGHVDIETNSTSYLGPAELRLYKSNMAILPQSGVGLQKRLADIVETDFDEDTYRLNIHLDETKIVVGKLAKRTGEFVERLRSALDSLSENTATIVRSLCPFLSPDQVVEMSRLMKEGRAAPLSKLHHIDSNIEKSLVTNAVDPFLKPYFEALKSRTANSDWFVGFKMIRPESGPEQGELPVGLDEDGSDRAEMSGDTSVEQEGDDSKKDYSVLHWFFFPLHAGLERGAPNVLAWESTSHSGRATYFFNTASDPFQIGVRDSAANSLESAVRRLNEALVLLSFRREPIYLSDTILQTDSRYRRYAIACRKIAALRELRSSYLGRAIHTSVDAWRKQVDHILRKI
jgi:hypothetical protein